MTDARQEPKYAYRLPPCPAYDVEGTERWLSEMARRGLHLSADGFFLGLAVFEKGEGREVTYRLEAVPNGGFFDDVATPPEEAIDLAAEYGWEHVGRRGEFYVYRTVREDAREMNTDPRVQALAMKAVRSRQRGSLFSLLFWLVLYPLLRNGAAVYQSPLLAAITLGTWLSLFGLVMILWLCFEAIRRAVVLERLYRRLARGESLYTAREDSARRDRRHRVLTVARTLLFTVWIILLAIRLLNWMTEQDEMQLSVYESAGGEIPFADVTEIASVLGEVSETERIMYGFGNTVLVWRDILSPHNMDYCEIAEVSLSDGRVVSVGLYVDYHETAAPQIAEAIARDYLRFDRREAKEDYKPLALSIPEADYAVAYLNHLHAPTVVIRCGNRVIHASLHRYSEGIEIPLELWTSALAASIQS